MNDDAEQVKFRTRKYGAGTIVTEDEGKLAEILNSIY